MENDWNDDEVKALENTSVSDTFLESFWRAQKVDCELFDICHWVVSFSPDCLTDPQ